MDAAAALAELSDLSAQVRAAAILRDGAVEAAFGPGAERLAETAESLLAAAANVRPGAPDVERVEVVLPEGGVFVVQAGGRVAVATTVPQPTAGLVLYDLRTCLRRIDDGPPAPKRRRKKPDA